MNKLINPQSLMKSKESTQLVYDIVSLINPYDELEKGTSLIHLNGLKMAPLFFH